MRDVIRADQIHGMARECALELPGTEVYPFTEGWEAGRVAGKWFVLFTELEGTPIINVKADPADVRLLTSTYEGMTPGYHMNKKHWVTLWPERDVSPSLLRALLEDSYLTVVASLPRARRPVDPRQFAQTLGRTLRD